MLDIDQTRARFNDWIKSPAFAPQVKARFKTPKWLFDTLLLADDLPSGGLSDPLIPCMASPGPAGTIIQLPPAVAVFKDKPYDPKIIHHPTRTTPPPLVAPHADNLEAVENHITRHLGVPEMDFKLAHGADALFERLEAAGHSDLFNPRRPPVA